MNSNVLLEILRFSQDESKIGLYRFALENNMADSLIQKTVSENPSAALTAACRVGDRAVAEWATTFGPNEDGEASLAAFAEGHFDLAQWCAGKFGYDSEKHRGSLQEILCSHLRRGRNTLPEAFRVCGEGAIRPQNVISMALSSSLVCGSEDVVRFILHTFQLDAESILNCVSVNRDQMYYDCSDKVALAGRCVDLLDYAWDRLPGDEEMREFFYSEALIAASISGDEKDVGWLTGVMFPEVFDRFPSLLRTLALCIRCSERCVPLVSALEECTSLDVDKVILELHGLGP